MTLWPKWIPINRPGRLTLSLVIFFSVVMGLRMALFPGGADDDGEILYYSQTWALSYKTGQPPFYAWLIKAVQIVTGPSMAGVLFVKYLLLILFYVFAYLAAQRQLRDEAFALAVPLGLMACFFIGWETVVSYSHTILAMTAMAATLWLMLRLEDHRTFADYAWLGLAMTVGLLAKYTFAVFLILLVIAAGFHPVLRKRVVCQRFAVVLGLAVTLAASPAILIWGMAEPGADAEATGLGNTISDLIFVGEDRAVRTLSGVFQFLLASIGLLSPFLIVAVLMFPKAFRPSPRPDGSLVRGGRFLEIYLLGLGIGGILAIAAFAAPDVRNNWLVVWFPAVFYVVLRIKIYVESTDGDARKSRLRWFGGALLVLIAAVPLGLFGRGLIAPGSCSKCNYFIPYAPMAEELRAGGFSGGVVIAHDYPNQLAGNLRRYFPNSRMISSRWHDYPPLSEASVQSRDDARPSGQCLLIWRGNAKVAAANETRNEAAQRLDIHVPLSLPVQRFELALPRASDRAIEWTYQLIKDHERCR